MHVTHGDPVDVWLQLEDGTRRDGLRQLENNRPPYDLDGRLVGEATFELPDDLPLGYHRVHLRVGAFDTGATVIVTPSHIATPVRMGRGGYGVCPLSSTACGPRSPGAWAISPT